jgi:VanZ family protein
MKLEFLSLAVFSTVVILFGSILPIPTVLIHEEGGYVIHLLSYVVCSYAWAQLLPSWRRYVAVMVVLTPVTELLQLPLPYRTPCVEDLIANLIGTLLGGLLAYGAIHLRLRAHSTGDG